MKGGPIALRRRLRKEWSQGSRFGLRGAANDVTRSLDKVSDIQFHHHQPSSGPRWEIGVCGLNDQLTFDSTWN